MSTYAIALEQATTDCANAATYADRAAHAVRDAWAAFVRGRASDWASNADRLALLHRLTRARVEHAFAEHAYYDALDRLEVLRCDDVYAELRADDATPPGGAS